MIKPNGTLWVSGSNNFGQLGLGDTINRSSPTQVGSDTDWTEIYCASSTTIAIKTNGTIWVWGGDYYGMLGLGTSSNHKSSPVQLGGDTNWSKISSSQSANYAIKTDGTLWSWGKNDVGQLGIGTVLAKSSPVQVGSLNTWRNISCSKGNGNYSVLATRTDNTAWGWGAGYLGRLGLGDTNNRSSPTQIGSGTNWSELYAAQYASYAIKTDGTLWVSGSTGYTTYTTGYNSSPIQVGSETDWASICVGYDGDNLLAKKQNGKIYAFGESSFAENFLGYNTDEYVWDFYESYGFEELSMFCFDYAAFALTKNGDLWGWGENSNGDLCLNHSNAISSPVQIGSEGEWKYCYIKDYSAFGIKNDGTLWAWGNNSQGQLGLGDTINRSSPTQVGSENNWEKVSTSYWTLAIKSDGTLWACGRNNYGQLGLGDTINRSSLVQIGTEFNWERVTVSREYGNISGALTSDGKVFVWGRNNVAQLGVGDLENRSSPTQLGSDTNWIKLSSAQYGFVAIKTDGTLWSWGGDGYGELMQGDSSWNRSSPIQIGSDTDWADVSSGENSTALIKTNGTLWVSGYHEAVGAGYYWNVLDDDLSSPTQIGSDTDWDFLSLGNSGSACMAAKTFSS